MPIYYASESEEQAKEACLKSRGLYTGRSRFGLYGWQTFTGACITTFVRATAIGTDRFMVVYNQAADVFEPISIESDSPTRDPFLIGCNPDAEAELRARYSHYLFEREEAKRKAKNLHLCKVQSVDEARLRRIMGKHIVVVAGKTIKHGTEGNVFWIGHGVNGDPRVGFEDAAGKRHWTSLRNVDEVRYLPLLEQAS